MEYGLFLYDKKENFANGDVICASFLRYIMSKY